MVVTQYPAGDATHEVWGGTSAADLSLIETIDGSFADGDIIDLALDTTARVVRIVTTRSASSVAWREIEVEFSP